MNLKVIKEINIDFYDNKIITVEAKQYDKSSRFIQISCYENGKQIFLNKNNITAFIRYKKPDEYPVFNMCSITENGDILVELSEQMLATSGLCLADIVIVDQEGSQPTITEDGEIQLNNAGTIVSTMNFYINIISAPYDYQLLVSESESEITALNSLLDQATKDYTLIIDETQKIQESVTISEQNAAQSAESAAQSAENAAHSAESAAHSAESASAIAGISSVIQCSSTEPSSQFIGGLWLQEI